MEVLHTQTALVQTNLDNVLMDINMYGKVFQCGMDGLDRTRKHTPNQHKLYETTA